METPTRSGDITVRRLRARLARQNARWRLFSRRHPDHTQSHFIAEREQHQSQCREIQLAIARSTPPARRFVSRWNFTGTLVSCGHCRVAMWLDERVARGSVSQPRFMLCCQSGRVMLPSLPPPPPVLDTLLNQPNFLDNIRMYNSMLSFTSMGGSIDHSVMDGHGPYSFRISGNNYHRIGSLLPAEGQRPKFGQLYIYDTHDEVRNRCRALHGQQRVGGVDEGTLQALQHMLDAVNPYVKVFRNARDIFEADAVINLSIRIIKARPGRQYTLPTVDEVAALIVGGDVGGEEHRDIIVRKIGGNLQRVYETQPSYMPLQYPLLFPYGTDGWSAYIQCVGGSSSNRVMVTMREFYAFLIQYRLDEGNILLRCGRLFLQFIVDCYAAIEAWRLLYIKNHQSTLRAELYSGLQDAITAGENDAHAVGKRLILPASFTGGPRYMRQHFLDAMAICNQMGYPDFFYHIHLQS